MYVQVKSKTCQVSILGVTKIKEMKRNTLKLKFEDRNSFDLALSILSNAGLESCKPCFNSIKIKGHQRLFVK